jgi:two-component system C4-dicarboxylate transport response regulator DctD
MNTLIYVYLIDDDDDFRASLKQSLELAGVSVTDFDQPEKALKKMDNTFAGVIISDVKMTGMDGLEFLMEASEIDEDIPIILVSGHADVSTAVQAIQDGAYDFLEKPFRTQTLLEVVGRAQEKRKLVLENRRLRAQLNRPRKSLILGDSSIISELRRTISQHAPSQANILISGELGVGKELVARSLHNQSNHGKQDFNVINCGSMSEAQLETALFGDGDDSNSGLLSKGCKGTLYLEEVDQLTNKLAINLLRSIKDIASARRDKKDKTAADVRIITSTHVPLEPLCRQGLFRDDLFYELSVLEISVPSLRDRRDDIPLLFKHYAAESSSNYGVPEPVWSESQSTQLAARDWRGNLRALRHMAERWVLTGGAHGHDNCADNRGGTPNTPSSLPDKIEQFEKMVLEQALQKNNGNVTKTHMDLCIPRKTLYDKLQRHGIKPEIFRNRSK